MMVGSWLVSKAVVFLLHVRRADGSTMFETRNKDKGGLGRRTALRCMPVCTNYGFVLPFVP
jgi:hypothetical protein